MSPAQRRTNAHWLRVQIENLHYAMGVRAMKTAEVSAALASITNGEPWQALPSECAGPTAADR